MTPGMTDANMCLPGFAKVCDDGAFAGGRSKCWCARPDVIATCHGGVDLDRALNGVPEHPLPRAWPAAQHLRPIDWTRYLPQDEEA